MSRNRLTIEDGSGANLWHGHRQMSAPGPRHDRTICRRGPYLDDGSMAVAPDHQQLTVNGQLFEVSYDPHQPGTYHFLWLTGPNPGYGFSSRISSHTRQPQQMLIDDVVNFLEQVDPDTGYIED